MSESPLRAALIGLGDVAIAHLEGYRGRTDVEVVAGADVRAERAGPVALRYGFEAFTDYRQMLDRVKPDIACVLTTVKTHREITEACADRGVNVLCEKPLALTVEDTEAMIAHCSKRGVKLLVLGKYSREHAYQASVMDVASDEVVFPGAVYEKADVHALRFFSLAYVHGHQVGGTNPSLVEALGAGNAVIAHDNPFNRWVAGEAGRYFADEDECERQFEALIASEEMQVKMRMAARYRWSEAFTWPKVLAAYQGLIEKSVNSR